MFQLESTFTPAGDQPKAIKEIEEGFLNGKNQITLLGATGTGKTFTMAHTIQKVQKPTLILSHNKTLAAQLATEFKYFFPNNAVHYFVSYFDYYQPESYLPERDVFIEKEATINKEIEMYRLATMASLLDRPDTIVIASVSAVYGVGSRDFFDANRIAFHVGKEYDFDVVKAQLLRMQYKPVQSAIEQGMFDIQGEMIDVYSSTENKLYRLIFNFNELEHIQVKESLTFETQESVDHVSIRPATQYMQDMHDIDNIIANIEKELAQQVKKFTDEGKLVEAQRLQKRVSYDVRMIKETGFVNGIENYSPYFEQRLDGAPPNTLFDYFPDDMLTIIDESHMTIPQFGGMPRADATRKKVLTEHGFRLPSAVNHRPIQFEEFSTMLSRIPFNKETLHEDVKLHIKKDAKTLFVSATPAPYEIDMCQKVVQQVIRPTGLLDPITYVYPKSGDYDLLLSSIDKLPDSEHELMEKKFDLELKKIKK